MRDWVDIPWDGKHRSPVLVVPVVPMSLTIMTVAVELNHDDVMHVDMHVAEMILCLCCVAAYDRWISVPYIYSVYFFFFFKFR